MVQQRSKTTPHKSVPLDQRHPPADHSHDGTDDSGGALSLTQVVNAAGATPVDTDVDAWANDTGGYVVGTGGRVWHAFKRAADVYYVEMTGI